MAEEQPSLEGMSDTQKAHAEEQIRNQAKVIDYAIREYPIEVLVDKYLDGAEKGANEIFVPDYQRNFVWPEPHQSRFIESVMIGLPIPYLFVADVGSEDEELSGRLEVVDGTQRLRTLANYITDNLVLTDLKKLSLLNSTKFSNLLPSRQRRFRRITIRLIELTERADEETRRDMFDRINSGAMELNPMETRRGVQQGPLISFIGELAKNATLHELAPLSEASRKRRDYDELVLRFFAYAARYDKFQRSVIGFIDDYVESLSDFNAEKQGGEMEIEFERMLEFVKTNFKYGFRRGATNSKTPRVRFESIAVGTALAFRENPTLNGDPAKIADWAYSEEFNVLVSSDGANSRPRIAKRIEYVRDQLLAGS